MVFEDLEPLIGYFFFLPCWPYVFGLILRKSNSSSNGWFIPSFPFCGKKSNSEHARKNCKVLRVVYVVVQFYPWFKLYFLLFWGMVMYDNEFETKENKI